jgi:hypothetical protein
MRAQLCHIVTRAAELPGQVTMRDSKDLAGPVLAFTHVGWRAFVGGIRASELGWP